MFYKKYFIFFGITRIVFFFKSSKHFQMTIAVISVIRDNWGGSEELWARMAEEALPLKHRVLHLSYETETIHSKMQSLIDKGLIVYTRPSYKETSSNPLIQFTGKSLNFIRKKISKSFEKVFQQRPDIIIYNGTCYSIAEERILMKELEKANIPFCIIGHFNDERGRGGISDYQVRLVNKAYRRCKKVMFISERSMQNAKRQLINDIPNGIIVRNPVNLSSTIIIPYPTYNQTQFAIVGNLRIIHKGQDIVLEVLSTDEWKKRNWHLNIYGSGEDENYLKELVSHYHLTEKVTFHGKVNDIRAVWEKNHILLMPSHMEGMPLAIVEAMICGRPCVATDVGGATEWIEDNISGFISEAPTVASFGKTMERAWVNLGGWEEIGKKGHERAMQLYDPEPGKTLLKLITESIS